MSNYRATPAKFPCVKDWTQDVDAVVIDERVIRYVAGRKVLKWEEVKVVSTMAEAQALIARWEGRELEVPAIAAE